MILAIIVTYNGEKYINDCLNSLIKQTQKLDILVVDNASNDNTCNIIKSNYPTVKIIDIGYNSGFAHANNVGMQYAINNSYEYVLLINEDTISDTELVENLLRYADANTAVAPKIYRNGSLTNIWYGAGKIDFDKCIAINCQQEFAEQVSQISFMTGCCMLIHTDILKKIGMFDESFFMYYEDTDLSLRMYENGIKMIYNPEACLWHRMQGRIIKDYYVYYMERNKLFFLKKHIGTFGCSLLKIIIMELYKILIKPDVVTAVFYRYKLKGLFDFIRDKMGKMEN